jgi:large subunit ribosomal protein L17
MRHKVAGYKLGRTTAHRRAMWKNMAVSLLTHGQITTTVPRAKSVQGFVEKLITLARKGDLASRRRVIQQIGDPYMITHDEDENITRNRYGEIVGGPRVVKHLFEEIGPRYKDRDGGYTRVVRLGRSRLGDGGDLCVLQLVGSEEGPQVSGQYSRRREKANRRMERAAQLRKASKSDEQAASAAVAEAEPEPQQPDAAPQDEQSTDEATDKS